MINYNGSQNVFLQNEDELKIYAIGDFVESENITIRGAVRNPGTIPYDYSNSLKIKDAVFLSGGVQKFATDFAYLKRQSFENPKTNNYIRIDLATALLDAKSPENIEIFPGDELVVYSKDDFTIAKNFSVQGYVNNPGTFDYGTNVTLADAINMSNGLKEAPMDFAYIERIDVSKPKEKYYIRKDLTQINDLNTIILPEDKIVFYSKADFKDEQHISIEGAVRKPGKYVFGNGVTLSDIISMSGGLTFNASKKRVDVYRLQFNSDEKTNTLAANLVLGEDNQPLNGSFELKPYDLIVIREASEFELIRKVSLKGEVKYPGTYALISENEKIESIISRAGGLTDEAFLEGTYIYRAGYDVGFISLQADKALQNNNSAQNVILQENDEIFVPKKNDLVAIAGNTYANRYYNTGGSTAKITVPFDKKKNAKYYVERYAGGITNSGDYKKLSVLYANGTVKSAKRFLFFKTYPKVEPGCTIQVPDKDTTENGGNSRDTDWNDVLTNAVGQATAVLTLILLVQRVD